MGIAFGAGHLLARVPRRSISLLLLLCLGTLTFFRCLDWKNDETLFSASWKVDVTPRGYLWQASEALGNAWDAHAELMDGRDDPEIAARLRREAEITVAAADGLVRYYGERLNVPPLGVGGVIRWKQANALLALRRDEEAYRAAKIAAAEVGAEPFAAFNAGMGAQRLGERRVGGANAARTQRDAASVLSVVSGTSAPGLAERLAQAAAVLTERRCRLRAAEYFEEAADFLSTAHHKGYTVDDLRGRIAQVYLQAATLRRALAGEEAGEERKGELLAAAAEDFLYAANTLSALYQDAPSKKRLENCINLRAATGEAYLGAVEALDEYRPPAQIAHLLRRAADGYSLVAHGQEIWGDPVEGLRTFIKATSIYENALRVAEVGGNPPETEEMRHGAAHCLFQAGRIAEQLNDFGGAAKFYANSLKFSPTPEANEALRRLSR